MYFHYSTILSGCVWRTFLRRVPSESLVASGASGRHRLLSTSTPQKTIHPRREFTFYAPGPPDVQIAQGASVYNLFSLLMILLVPKPDGSLGLCVEYGNLNKLTIVNKVTLPLMDDL